MPINHYGPIFLLPNNDHVGCAGLRPYKPQEQIYELGYHLRRQYWGMGLAEEAGRAVVNFAFENLGAKALFAGHHPQNLTSRRVLEKVGFRFTLFFRPVLWGIVPEHQLLRSSPCNSRSSAG